MVSAWDPPASLLETLRKSFSSQWLISKVREEDPLYHSKSLREISLPPGLLRSVLDVEIHRCYRNLVYLTFSPDRAEWALKSIRWKNIVVSDTYRFCLPTDPQVDLADAIFFYPVVLECGAIREDCGIPVREKLLQVIPSMREMVKLSASNLSVGVYQSKSITWWVRKVAGVVSEPARAQISLDWLTALFAREALDRSQVLPSLSSWNTCRGALQSCIDQFGLAAFIARIESASATVVSPFDLR